MVALQEDIATMLHGEDVSWINGIRSLSKTHAGINGKWKAEDVVALEIITDVIARIRMGITLCHGSIGRSHSRQTLVDA